MFLPIEMKDFLILFLKRATLIFLQEKYIFNYANKLEMQVIKNAFCKQTFLYRYYNRMIDILEFIDELKELQVLYNEGELCNFDFESIGFSFAVN